MYWFLLNLFFVITSYISWQLLTVKRQTTPGKERRESSPIYFKYILNKLNNTVSLIFPPHFFNFRLYRKSADNEVFLRLQISLTFFFVTNEMTFKCCYIYIGTDQMEILNHLKKQWYAYTKCTMFAWKKYMAFFFLSYYFFTVETIIFFYL